MSVRQSTARHTANSVSFIAWSYCVTLFNESDGKFPKAKLYAIKKQILDGKSKLDIEHFRCFDLLPDGTVAPLFPRSLFAINQDTSKRVSECEKALRRTS